MNEGLATPKSIRDAQTVIDDFITNSRGKLTFPLLYIENPSDALAVLLDSMNVGSLPLVVQYHGRFAKLASIKPKPEVMKVVVETFRCWLYISASVKYSVSELSDFIEIDGFQLEPFNDL